MHCTDFSIFSDKTIEHFMQPQNVGYMEDADAVGISGEPGLAIHWRYLSKFKIM